MTNLTNSNTVYPLSAVRALALHAQGLGIRSDPKPLSTLYDVYSIIEQIGCLQIDTLQMVRRSQNIALWSRLGSYDPADLDRLLFDGANRRLFEYWLHAACIIPFSEYRYRLPLMLRYQGGIQGWRRDWVKDPENAKLAQSVLERIRVNGPARSADFEHKGSTRSGWWDWKPSKRALEHLYNCGELMVGNRVNFQRVYDLRERVLPDWVDTSVPTESETARHLLERSMLSLGICQPNHVAGYTSMKRTEAKPHLEQLTKEGVFVAVQGVTNDDGVLDFVVHRDSLPLLEEAADGALSPKRTTFLSPFDSLFWAKGRDMQLWGFEQTLEAYKPAPIRKWGYFCLPILHKERLVGRFDPKLERRTGVLRLKAIYLEPGIPPDDELVASVAAAMRDFMNFHDATSLVIERSEPTEFGDRLLAAL